ncbi:MAG: serine/threonine-protein phosphatase [Planctomycetes bacterium]|nr:serine/threonine-protein phosphatase [Planctomycetota bacterium]
MAETEQIISADDIIQPPAAAPAVERELAEDTVEQLKMAGQVQRSFLPQTLPDNNRLRWSVIFEPADWVSGDIYDVARLDETHIGFYIADAVGHSMPAALLTMFLKQALTMRQTTGNNYRIFEPAEVIANLNQAMAAQQLTGCLFATCCYCLLDTETHKLSFARAGHPYPILMRKDKLPEQLETTGGLLGVFEESQFEQGEIQLDPGDKLFLYSDGCESIVGACNDDGGFVFQQDFSAITTADIDRLMGTFHDLVRNKEVKPAEKDDVTALALEIL